MALTRREQGADVELTHHSDAGSQYTAQTFQQVLDDHRVPASIGTVGDAYENAMAESFVDTFKTELIRDRAAALAVAEVGGQSVEARAQIVELGERLPAREGAGTGHANHLR
ncbi:MAG: DDE-type integrase/transposase/recombinase [Actinobacteria bacterium]|nr:DDE-type integrase/transposase/recombinase [Actinomycetota bacterium]